MLRQRSLWTLLGLAATIVLGWAGTPQDQQDAQPGSLSPWKLVWSAEFDGKEIDRTK